MISNQSDELLTCLSEEAAEVTQVACKALRFGIDDWHPVFGLTNREMLTQEVGDLLAVVDRLITAGVLDCQAVEIAKTIKHKKLDRWLRQPAEPAKG